MNQVIIIAEAGVNHECSMKLARRLIDEAAFAGANAFKFQTYKAEEVTLLNTRKAKYQMQNSTKDQTQFKMLKKYEIPKAIYLIDEFYYTPNQKIDRKKSKMSADKKDKLKIPGL